MIRRTRREVRSPLAAPGRRARNCRESVWGQTNSLVNRIVPTPRRATSGSRNHACPDNISTVLRLAIAAAFFWSLVTLAAPAEEAWRKQAENSFQRGDYESALRLYEAEERRNPSFYDAALLSLWSITFETSLKAEDGTRRTRAVDDPAQQAVVDRLATAMRRAISRGAGWDDLVLRLSQFERERGRLTAARDVLSGYAASHPNDFRPRAEKVSILLQEGKIAEAIRNFDEVRSKAAKDANALYLLGRAGHDAVLLWREKLSVPEARVLLERSQLALERVREISPDVNIVSEQTLMSILRWRAALEEDESRKRDLRSQADRIPARIDSALRPPDAPPAPAPQESLNAAGALRVGGDVKAPVTTRRVPVVYTEAAKKNFTKGIVIFDAVIGEDGKVRDAIVTKALPDGLSEAALHALRQWEFRPGTQNGKPVAVIFTVIVNCIPPE
jgi:TonB family protein